MTLRETLMFLGYMHEDDFLRQVECFRKLLYPAWTLAELLCNPHESGRFCEIFREKTCQLGLPDRAILWALLSIHCPGIKEVEP